MFHVDNSGKGDSMYYAYGISLMYFLRAKNAPETAEKIFDKLKLKEEDRVRLRALLAKDPTLEFSSEEIKTIIEPILGKALRELAADFTAEEFKRAPQENPLFAAAKYGFEFCFKHTFNTNDIELGSLIDHDSSIKEYTEAEMYKVIGMKEAMLEFTSDRLFAIIEEYSNLWSVKELEFKEQGKQLSAKDIKFHQSALLDQLLRKQTLEFFLADDYKHLKKYINHLKKVSVLGSEETLFILHKAIQGERMERNHEGNMVTHYDAEIPLHLHRNGNSPFPQPGSPVMVVNNQSNIHWTSKIPESVFVPKPVVVAPKLTTETLPLIEVVKTEPTVVKVLEPKEPKLEPKEPQAEPQILEVDNSGRGNCMYYAYGISLMYFLRAKNIAETTETVFNKLKLKEEDRVRLRALLAKDPKQEFTVEEIKTTIEPILGKAARDLAAEYTVEEFKRSPKDHPLFAAAKYGFDFCFKHTFESNGSELAGLIDHEFSNADYTESEIYKVSGIKEAMLEYTSSRLPYVIEEFKRQWALKEQEFKEQEKQLSEKEIQTEKAKALDLLLRKETIDFFSENEFRRLAQYKEHLQKDTAWGSEETLLALHRAVQGERMVRNHEGAMAAEYETEILLHLHRNGSSPFSQAGSPVMIINNLNNVHWTSKIPLSQFVPSPSALAKAKPLVDTDKAPPKVLKVAPIELQLEPKMLHVDNSGRGNCMYYAYSISLMYFLRAKNASEATESVFNKLKLKEEDRVRLRTLLAKDSKQEFSSHEVETVIEPILGKATREMAAEYTAEEFKRSPQDSPLFSAAKYGVDFCFKHLVEDKESELANLIDHEFTNPDYTEAEIYKVSGMKEAILEYTTGRAPQIIEEFKRQWALKEQEFKEKEKQLTEKEIQTQKAIVLDLILRKETIEFFSANDFKRLAQYTDHLRKEFVWGSEETLFVLHRGIQGERMVPNSKGTTDIFYDTEILLHLHRNGSSPFAQKGSPGMILNNQSNVHWTSKIPVSIFVPKPSALPPKKVVDVKPPQVEKTKAEPKMLQVDNSGRGNCMYYAYSISLMYFLRAKNASTTTEDIFNKLKLKEEDKVQLRVLLTKKPNQEFSSHEIETIIEPILGRATRDLAAEHTKDEFKNSPQDTPLFTVAKYGLEHYIKQSLASNGSDLAKLIDHKFTNPAYTQAEIYRVAGMKTAMQEFAAGVLPTLIEEFNQQWEIKEQEFKKQDKQFSESEIQIHKAALLDKILRGKTVEFFTNDEDKYLNQYVKHLQKAYVWGTEETLFVLHRAVQGERFVRNTEGTVDTLYDTEIPFHLHRNGSSPFAQAGTPVMILNNQDNVHWTSKIPLAIFAPKPTAIEQKLYKILDDMEVECDGIPAHLEEHSIARELINAVRKQLDTFKENPNAELREKAADAAIQLVSAAIPKLGKYESWRTLFYKFFDAIVDYIPAILGGPEIRSGLTQYGLYSTDRRPPMARKTEELKVSLEVHKDSVIKEESSTKQSPKGVLSQSAQHTLFKKQPEVVQKTYPQEISLYVRESKQTGPRVAKALRQMYQIGLEGNEQYSLEKCRDLAQRYISYAKYNNRHFNLTEVSNFLKEMNELIKQKEEAIKQQQVLIQQLDEFSDEQIEYVDSSLLC